MAIDATTAARAVDTIRATLETEMPPDKWQSVAQLVTSLDEAIVADDDAMVARMTADLDALRFERGDSEAAPPQVSSPLPGAVPSRSTHRLGVGIAIACLLGILTITVLASGDHPRGAPASDVAPDPPVGSVPDLPVFGPELSVRLAEGGDLNIELSWDNADLDLIVTEPDLTVITPFEPGPTISGGSHQGDGNADCVDTGSQETIHWTHAEPGTYKILVRRNDVAACGRPARYLLTVDSDLGFDDTDGVLFADDQADTISLRARRTVAAGGTTTSLATVSTAVVASQGKGDDGGDLMLGVVAGGVAAASVILLVGFRRSRRTPVPEQDPKPPEPRIVARPLPAPPELRELANHTIHLLDFR